MTAVTVLVTGGTGFLGNNIVRQLIAAGQPVRVLARQRSQPPPSLAGLPLQVIDGDVCDSEAVRRSVQGASCVIHCAALVHLGHRRRDESFAVNVQGTQHVLTAAAEAGAAMVHVSTVDTLAAADSLQRPIDERSPAGAKVSCSYVDSKRAAEALVEQAAEHGQQVAVAHPGFMLGPWDWRPTSGQMLLEVHRRRPLAVPPGGLSVCHVAEVAAALIRLSEKVPTGAHYILAGTNVSLRELWTRVAVITGGRPPRMPLGPLMRWVVGRVGDSAARFRDDEPPFNSAAVRLSALYHYYSSEKAIADLEYRIPPVDQCFSDSWFWLGRYGYHP